MTRRDFLQGAARGLKGLAVFALPASVISLGSRAAGAAKKGASKVRWGFLVDTDKCLGCGLCVQACKQENGIPLDSAVSRTWVERYVVTRDGKVFADTPNAGQDGFTSPRIDQGSLGYRDVPADQIEKAFFVPKLCNHCDHPACVQVCPVGATYQTEDGIVLVDRKTCIGCGYCVMACPYGARFFHPGKKVTDKCTFCYHRLDIGLEPACVEVCPAGARLIGNLKDPSDPVAQAVLREKVGVLKDEYGTKPQVYYIGLSKEVR